MSELRGLLVAIALLSLPGLARAQTAAGLELTWDAPAGCSGKSEVLREIERLLGSDRALVEGAPLRALGTIRFEEQRFRLELSFPSASPELTRVIESDSCDELDEAAALILALSLDPDNPRLASAALPVSVKAGASAATEQPAQAPAAAPEPATEPAPPPKPVKSREAPREAPPAADSPGTPLRFDGPPELGARAALEVGTLPSAAAGGLVDVTVPVAPILLSTQLSLYAPQTVLADGLDGAGGSFLYGGLAVLPCWRWSAGPVALAPCAALEAAFIFASGQGVDEPEQPFTWFPRFGVGAEFGYALSPRIAIAAGVFGNIQPARPTFIVQDLELFSPSLFALRVSAGIEFAL